MFDADESSPGVTPRDAAAATSSPRDAEGGAGFDRRGFLLLGLGVVAAGCTSGVKVTELPGPAWPAMPPLPSQPPAAQPWKPASPAPSQPSIAGVLSRSRWASGAPVPSLMNPMLPVRYITVHHDGMDAFARGDERSVIGRLETIRTSHRRKGWGDIGYHYIIDPSGRVWEGRPLTYQGAHVKDRNEGNIGVMVLGNYDRQGVNASQAQALRSHLGTLMRRHGVGVRNVYTHQEWPDAKTACPGRTLEAYMKHARNSGQLA